MWTSKKIEYSKLHSIFIDKYCEVIIVRGLCVLHWINIQVYPQRFELGLCNDLISHLTQ